MERVDCKEARKEGGNMAAGYKAVTRVCNDSIQVG